MIVLFAAILALLPNNLVGSVLILLVMLPFFELSFGLMEQVASGDTLDSNVKKYLTLKNKSMFIKLVLAYAFVILILAKLYGMSSGFSLILSAFFILGIPASMIILMMEKSIFSMLNPIKIGFIIKQFGGAYFLLYAFMLTIVWLSVAVANGDSVGRFSYGGIFTLKAISLYLTICVFLMAGYLVYQYHYELNFTINRQSLYQVDAHQNADDLAEVNIFIQEGRYEDAQTALLKRIEVNAEDYRANEKLILLYGVQGNESHMLKIADPYFSQMVAKGKQKQAVDFLQGLSERSIRFLPQSAEVVLAMVSEMHNKHQFIFALKLLDDFLAKNPRPDNWEKFYFQKAQLLAEYSNRTIDAKEVLTHIINRGIDQDTMQQAEDYLSVVIRKN